jgi:hypothetical protein
LGLLALWAMAAVAEANGQERVAFFEDLRLQVGAFRGIFSMKSALASALLAVNCVIGVWIDAHRAIRKLRSRLRVRF